MICTKCKHRPSMRAHVIGCDGVIPDCPCSCHDAADAGPALLAVAQSILNDATGQPDDLGQRRWPIRAENYRQLTAAIALAEEPTP